MNYGDTSIYDGENSLLQPLNGSATDYVSPGQLTVNGMSNTISNKTQVSFQGLIEHSHLVNCDADSFTTRSLQAQTANFDMCDINGGTINNTTIYTSHLMNPHIHFATINGGNLESVSLVNTVNLMPSTLITIDGYVIEATELKKMLKFIQALHKDLHPQEYKERNE